MPMDRSKYSPNWEEISLDVKNRAGWRCEFCRAEHGQPHPDTGSTVVLTTAHLDHDTTNNAPGNLRALCQRCHLTYDAPHHARNAAITRRRKLVAAGQMSFVGG